MSKELLEKCEEMAVAIFEDHATERERRDAIMGVVTDIAVLGGNERAKYSFDHGRTESVRGLQFELFYLGQKVDSNRLEQYIDGYLTSRIIDAERTNDIR